MIVRIVKMEFLNDRSEAFAEFSRSIQGKIRAVKGCLHLDLLRDIEQKNIFFSYSFWESEEDLENYRCSEFFLDTWGKVSPWFKEKARAWSTIRLN